MKETITIPASQYPTLVEIETLTKTTVQVPVNQAPVISLVATQSITLPTNSVDLVASASDIDGTIASVRWTKVSGPSSTLSGTTTTKAKASNLVAGEYVFQIRATDDKGAITTARTTITVNPAPVVVPPTTGYLGLPLSTPKIYNNQSNIVIEGLRWENTSGTILQFNNCSNVTIRNCYFGKSTGEAISMNGGSNFTIENNLFCNNRTMVYPVQTTGGIVVRNNEFINADGPMPRGQYVQLNTCSGAGNIIENNRGESFEGESGPEDLISLFASKGTQASPILVKNNIFRGGGPSGSGGGIMAGDYGGQWIICEDNKLVNPGQYGIAASGGYDVIIRNNMVYADRKSWNNIGYYIADYTNGAGGGRITFSGNRSNYTNSSGARNDFWNSGELSCTCSDTTSVTLAEMNVPAHLFQFITAAELTTIRNK